MEGSEANETSAPAETGDIGERGSFSSLYIPFLMFDSIIRNALTSNTCLSTACMASVVYIKIPMRFTLPLSSEVYTSSTALTIYLQSTGERHWYTVVLWKAAPIKILEGYIERR
jgi:hypothetical protein